MNDLILLVLMSWVLPLALFVYYATTTPISGARWRRRLMPLKSLRPVTVILVAQKIALILVVTFIGLVRFTGGFPGRDWVAFGLYSLLVVLAWTVFIYLRRVQSPHEHTARSGPSNGETP